MVSKFSQSLPRKLVFLFRLISLGISALAAGTSSVLLLVWRCFFLGALDFPIVFPDSQGFLKFLEGLLRDCERRPRKFDS